MALPRTKTIATYTQPGSGNSFHHPARRAHLSTPSNPIPAACAPHAHETRQHAHSSPEAAHTPTQRGRQESQSCSNGSDHLARYFSDELCFAAACRRRAQHRRAAIRSPRPTPASRFVRAIHWVSGLLRPRMRVPPGRPRARHARPVPQRPEAIHTNSIQANFRRPKYTEPPRPSLP
ncbi:hypothetical protein CERSUDRAFT_115118, partial [Gelatoporia subvermispora B]